jgi:hypothetical protein
MSDNDWSATPPPDLVARDDELAKGLVEAIEYGLVVWREDKSGERVFKNTDKGNAVGEAFERRQLSRMRLRHLGTRAH